MATELATAYISLVPSARGMKSAITREMDGAGADGSASIGRHMERGPIGSNLKGTLVKAFRGAALAGTGILAAGVGGAALADELLSTGAEVEQWSKKTDTVFEGSAGSVRDWAKANAEAFGMSDENVAGLAANFGDLLKPMGFTADQAAGMSTEVVGLAGALSEWTGGTRSVAEVSEILSSAMLGEREALKGLGINISEADVQARLAAKGQDKLTGAALEQAKALATKELIFEKSIDAQKAYADGGNEALRAQNQLKAKFAEIKQELAAKLTPALATAASWLADHLPGAIEWARNAFETISAWFKGDGASIAADAQTTFGTVKQVLGDVVAFVRENWPQIRDTISSVMGSVRDIVVAVVDIVSTFWNRWGDDILNFASVTLPYFMDQFKLVYDTLAKVVQLVAALFKGDWSQAWELAKGIVDNAFSYMENLSDLALRAIRNLLTVTLQFIVDQIKATPDRIASAASGMWDGIKYAWKAALNWIIRKWNDLEFKLPEAEFAGVKIGGYALGTPNIPEFHQGGIYRAPTPGGEGLAMLRDGEQVLTPEQRAGAGLVIQTAYFGASGSVVRDLDLWSRRAGRNVRVGAA